MTARTGVALRNNNTANAAVRDVSYPAPTLYFSKRVNYCAWVDDPA